MSAVCLKCGIKKDANQFSPNWRYPEGHIGVCKPCRNEQTRVWRANNLERAREYGKVKHARFRAAHPLKSKTPRITEDGRLCSCCKERKPEPEFGLRTSSPDGRSARCKACMHASEAASRAKDIDAARERDRITGARRYANHREALVTLHRKYGLKSRYNLSFEERSDLLASQNGLCAICRQAISIPDGKRSELDANVDHDHTTKKIRGMLCGPCNRGLGHFSDDPKRLLAAIAYLQFHSG